MGIARPVSKSPLPKEAKAVFQGEVFTVFQWQQQLYDGSLATYEKIRRPDSVVVIAITKEKNILLIEEEQPTYPLATGIIAGRLEAGEDPEAGAWRELLEETGYQAESMQLWEAEQPEVGMDWAVYTFIARGCEKITDQKLDPGERIRVFEVSFEEFIRQVTQDSFRIRHLGWKILQAKLTPQKLENLHALLFPD